MSLLNELAKTLLKMVGLLTLTAKCSSKLFSVMVSTVEDITRSVLFILNSSSINGNVITIDGGQSLQKLARDVAFID